MKPPFAGTACTPRKTRPKAPYPYPIYPSQKSAYRLVNNAWQKEDTPKRRRRLVGYACVSTTEQDLTLQLDALKRHGCNQKALFVDTASGARAQCPGLVACLATLQAGDVLVVWRLDRLGRSMSHLVTLVEQLRVRGIGFRSICDGVIDTTTASGELIFNLFSALAQFRATADPGADAQSSGGGSRHRPAHAAREDQSV